MDDTFFSILLFFQFQRSISLRKNFNMARSTSISKTSSYDCTNFSFLAKFIQKKRERPKKLYYRCSLLNRGLCWSAHPSRANAAHPILIFQIIGSYSSTSFNTFKFDISLFEQKYVFHKTTQRIFKSCF